MKKVFSFILVLVVFGCGGDDNPTGPTAAPGEALIVFDGWYSITENSQGYTTAYGYGKNIGTATAKLVQCSPCVRSSLDPQTIEVGAIGTFSVFGVGTPRVPDFYWDN